MSHSLNELEALTKRAARGAGYAWGHAEEAGKAARWLAGYALPSTELLAAHLNQMQGREHAPWTPHATDVPWRCDGAMLCPLLTGAALSDRAFLLAEDEPIEFADTAFPLLLAPYIAAVARRIDRVIVLSWVNASLSIGGHGLSIAASYGELTVHHASMVTCRASRASGNDCKAPSATRVTIASRDLSVLSQLAARCYAPATESSRLLGAGAGLTDND